MANLEKGVYVKPQRLTLGEHLQQWLDGYVKTNCSPRTFDGYKSIVENHLSPNLGHTRLNQLQPQDVQQYYARVLAGSLPDRKDPLSPQTVLHHHRVLSEALKYGVRQGLLARNVCELVDAPRAKAARMRTLTPEEVAVLFDAARNTVYYPIIYTAVHTGLRQAELLGLRWRDVDLDLLSVSVPQTLYKRRRVCYFKEPKSEHSRRRVSLSPRLSLFLRQHRVQREGGMLTAGEDAL